MPARTLNARQWWLVWLLACSAVFSVHFSTIGLHELVNQDEVQILEFGRTFFEPDSDWGMNWELGISTPVMSWTWPAAAAQELAYRSSAPSHTGPRLVALGGALLAASLAFGWLRARDTPAWPAVLIALLFLLDPIFTQTFREGRVDGWAFGAVFAACWLLRASGPVRLRLLAVGALSAVAPFLWSTALALVPLLVVEFLQGLKVGWRRGTSADPASFFRSAGWVLAGGLAAATALATPILLRPDEYLGTLESALAVQRHAAAIKQPLLGMYVLHDPLLLPAVAVAFLLRRDWAILAAAAVALLMMYQTMMYPKRIMYLLPYFLAVMGGAWAWLHARDGVPRRRILAAATLGLLLAGNLWWAVLKPTALAIHQEEARSGQAVAAALSGAIGPGPHRVLLEEWDVYYGARALGWKVFKIGGPASMASEEYRRFLRSMDYVLLRETWMFKVRPDQLLDEGFEPLDTIRFPRAVPGAVSWGPFTIRSPEIVYDDLLVFRNMRARR